ncbi:MAG: phosphoserine transaminase [Pseudomonadota bacterium]
MRAPATPPSGASPAPVAKPTRKPADPNFSSGPCTKFPGWTVQLLAGAAVGRSHRAKEPKAKLKAVIDRSKALLGLPDDWLVGIVPGSDTGAVEMAMWSMLGARPVTVLEWESFSKDWATDALKQLQLANAQVMKAEYGALPDLAAVDPAHDLVFAFNGTTSGVRVPDLDWIAEDREGIVICDATSAAFAMEMDLRKLDVVTWSWQKVLGSEAAHGMLAVSPRAVERLETYVPPRALPKLFRLTKAGKLNAGIFQGATINTPSMLAVEDVLAALDWADRIGGGPALVARAQANFAALDAWVQTTPWIDWLAGDSATRSCTSMCLKIVDPAFQKLSPEAQAAFCKGLVKLVEAEGAAYDFNGYRDAPAGLRIWGGATVETGNIEALTPWLEWAFATQSSLTFS